MLVGDLIGQPGAWLSTEQITSVVVSSRARLARNVRGVAFPEWAGEEERVRLCSRLRSACGSAPSLDGATFFDMGALSKIDKEVLHERRLISYELAARGKGSGLLLGGDEGIAVMINEEDHLRLQAISPGMDLSSVWSRVNRLDSELEKAVEYAFDSELGYLTACPTNVGTGLRAGVMMHLAGLMLMREAEQVAKGVARMGYAVRGLAGEGSEAGGAMYQISNQSTLGESEDDIIAGLTALVKEIIGHEMNARARLLEQKETYLLDQLGRAYGIITNARMLSSREAIDLLSVIKLGCEMGLVRNVDIGRINEIIVMTQPGHLQKTAVKVLSPQERDEVRAGVVKHRLGKFAIAK